MREFNRLLEYREYYIYDTEHEVFCIATGAAHTAALELYMQLVEDYFPDEYTQWKFQVALDCVHNFSDKDIKTIQSQEKIFNFHHGYGMYVRNHYVYGNKKYGHAMADGVSDAIEKLIYTIVLPVYNCFSKEFMKLMENFDFRDIHEQYRNSQPVIGRVLRQLAEPDNITTAEEALKIIRDGIRANLSPKGFQEIAIPICLEHIEKFGHINKEPIELVNALYGRTKVYYKHYNQLKAIIDMRVPIDTMGPSPRLKTLEETSEYIMDNLGLCEEDALCMAECAMAIGKKQREVLDRDPNSFSKILEKINAQVGTQKK